MSVARFEDVFGRSKLSLPIMHRRHSVLGCGPEGYLSNGFDSYWRYFVVKVN